MATAAPPTPLEVLQGRLAAYLRAEAKILEAQSYQFGDGSAARMLQRAELLRVQQAIDKLQGQIATFTPGARRVTYLR